MNIEELEEFQQQQQQQGRILQEKFYEQIHQENDGFQIIPEQKVELVIQQNQISKLKEYQTNPEWQQDQLTLISTLTDYSQLNNTIHKIDLKQQIVEDYKLSFEVSTRQKQKLEEKDAIFLKYIRQSLAEIRRKLINFYELNQLDQTLYEDIKELRRISQQISFETVGLNYKCILLEDICQIIERI